MPYTHVQEHIDLIAKHEEEFLAQRTRTERLSDSIASFVGSLPFVIFHVCAFLLWIVWNTLPSLHHFDARPYSLLGTLVALEAIILASLILMRQARMSRRADQREHLMLQVLLLTEKEITAVLRVDRQIAEQVGVQMLTNNSEVKELSKSVSIEDVAQTIKENVPMAD